MAFVFEDEQPKSRFVFEDEAPKKEGVYEGLVKPTLKAAPRVAGATVGGLIAYPFSGIAGLARLITTGDVNEAAKTVEGIQGVPGQLIQTPEQAKSMEYIGYPMKPFEWAREGGQAVGRKTGIPYAEPVLGTLGEAGAMFALPKTGKLVRKATDFKALERPGEMPSEVFTKRTEKAGEQFYGKNIDALASHKDRFVFEEEPFTATESGAVKGGVTRDEAIQAARNETGFEAGNVEDIYGSIIKEAEQKAAGVQSVLEGMKGNNEPLKLPPGQGFQLRESQINTYFDSLKESVGRLELNKAEKAQLEKAIETDRKSHIERIQQEQIDSEAGNVEGYQFEPAPAPDAYSEALKEQVGNTEIPVTEQPKTTRSKTQEQPAYTLTEQGFVKSAPTREENIRASQSEQIGAEAGNVDEIYRHLRPKVPKELEGVTLASGIDPTKTLAVLKSLKEKAGKSNVVRGIRQEIQSPERILGTEEAGRKIYKAGDFFDQQKNKFLYEEASDFEKAVKGIKEESPEAIKIGEALDGKISREQLSPREQILHDFFKKKYDYLIKRYARKVAETEEGYQKALRAANRVKLERLHGEKLEAYKEKLIEDLNMTEGEAEAFDIMSRQMSKYLPHIFDNELLKQEFKAEIARLNEKMRLSTNDASIKGYKERLKQLEQAVTDLEGGKPIAFRKIPKNIRFRFFEPRSGKEGYSFDAIKAYKAYLTGISRKMFDAPALKEMEAAAVDLSPELKPYAEWYMKRYMGMNKHPLDSLASGIASFQWMRTLGLNPRSALVNLTQRLNTIATVGEKYSLKGEKFGFTDEGKRLFDETGLAREIPNVLMEGDVSPRIEGIRKIVGLMFDKVEKGNRKHAFLSGYLKAKDMGMAEQAAIQYGIDVVHKTQFRYGRVGMPKALSSPLGRVAFQFSSYPIKQIEFLSDMARNNPAKFIKFLAYAEGGNLALQEFLDTDMSNAMGVGVTWAEVLSSFKDLSKGDIREASRHIRLAVNPGGGLLPAGLGPTATSIGKIASGVSEGKGMKALTKELTPVVYQRGKQAVQAIEGEKGGKYPIYNTEGHLTTKLDAGQLIRRTIGPRTAQEYKEGKLQEQKASLNEERKQIMNEIVNAIVDKDYKTARALIGEHKLVPTKEQIEQEIYRRNLTRMQRGHLKKPGKVQAFEYQKEGRIY